MNRLSIKTHVFDQKLYEWFQNKRARNFLISQDNMKGMALKLANKYDVKYSKASDGYINRFRARHKINSRSVVGVSGIVKTDTIEDFKEFYNSKLLEYEPKNIFDADETVLFWRHNANRTLVVNEYDKASGKFSKERVTILFCVSLEVAKMKPVIIGKAKSPSSFKGKDINNLNLI
ncbi:Tigger transposable element-derived protein 6 [Dictyocoela muelleri]|nr:Tigger transposable element-derived protein 6 [Dictyocoela muelleri]